MKQLFLLKHPLDLAAAEVLSLTKAPYKQYDEVLIVNTSKQIANRLAYTKTVYEVLYDCHKDDLLFKTNRHHWKCKTFSIKHPDKAIRNDLVDIIRKKSKLKLTKPEFELHCFIIGDHVYVTRLTYTSSEDFKSRKPHSMPAPHPASCDPRLARAMVNLTGIQKGKILDPFCGAGGILAEAALMGLQPIGFDIDKNMLNRAEINLKKLKCKVKHHHRDARTLPSTNYIVSDLPYGKGTKVDDLTGLYSDFFKVLKKKLKKRAVIGVPNFVDLDHVIKKNKLKVTYDFLIYIHKSLSKRIIVFSS